MSSSPSPTSTPSKSTASTAFQLHYRKHKYTPDTIEPALLYDIQNYIPIYSRFFDINETNYNGIQLNQKYYLQNIISHPSQIMESGRDDRDDQDDRDTSRSLNHLETIIADDNGNTSNVPIFVKYSPLLDPIRYLSGKYQVQENKTRTLPKYNSTPDDCEEKMLNTNNTSYVDGFFSYLTSRALHTHGVVHGVDYYGSYLCKQREFSTNVFDDIDYLVGCAFFNNYENDLFSIDYSQFGDDIEGDLSDVNMSKMMKIRNKMKSMIGPTGQDSYLQTDDDYHSMKNRINILDHISESESGICDDTVTIEPEQPLSLDVSVLDTDTIDRIQSDTCADAGAGADAPEVVDVVVNDETDTISSVALHPKKQTRDHDEMSDSDSSQSNSSYTTMSNDDDLNPQDSIQVDDSSFAKEDEGKGDESGSGSGSETGDDDTGSGSGDDTGSETGSDSDSASYDSDDEQIIVKIKDFPIQAILLEKCVSTLDRIMMTDELTKEEWSSILFQIIMTLIMYQKMFEFTHNDLHTNNVMFVETTEEFLYYFYEDQYYKVPTYGRIFKIIDFGRAIYKFRGELICSDSFHPKGDAATQYNFPPYYNPDKPTVEPNFSFDLCRFACALFDYFIYDLRKVEKLCKSDPIIKLVVKWTTDDKGRNVLYKSNGEERYPDFKLYKMISRSVHGHIPSNEIHNPLFDTYKITHKKYKKHAALSAKFLKDGRNTHIIMNVDALPSYSGGGSGCSETAPVVQEVHSSQ
jgi:hypothetical protein